MSSVPESPAPARGLGRGPRGAASAAAGGEPELLHLPVDAIHANPRQPRRRFEPEATAGLAARSGTRACSSRSSCGRGSAGGYELIAGERRWRAAREAGLETLPALVREADDRDSLLLGLVENVAREHLSPVEEARAYAVARRRVRALARRRRGARRPLEARACRTGCACSSSPRRCSGCSPAAS